jgi:hypothetical protein
MFALCEMRSVEKLRNFIQTDRIVVRRIAVLTVYCLPLYKPGVLSRLNNTEAVLITQQSPCQLCCHTAAAGSVRRSPIQMNHKVPWAGARAGEQTNRITSLGTQNQVDFHVAIRMTSLCVSFYLLRYTDVSAFVSVLFAGQTIGKLVKQVAVSRGGASSLP